MPVLPVDELGLGTVAGAVGLRVGGAELAGRSAAVGWGADAVGCGAAAGLSLHMVMLTETPSVEI